MTPTPTVALVIREKTIQAKFQRPPPAFHSVLFAFGYVSTKKLSVQQKSLY